MTKEEARAWRDRWRKVNEFTLEEARNATVDKRFHDLRALYAFARKFGGPNDEEGIAEVRRRWVRLKEHFRGK